MNNGLQPPKFFEQYCSICGWTEEQINEAWQKILTKTFGELSEYIKSNLGDEDICKTVNSLKDSDISKDVWSNLLASLPSEKKSVLANKIIEALTKNLDGFYEALRQKLSTEQKQVLQNLGKNINYE